MDPFGLGRAHHEPSTLPGRRAPAGRVMEMQIAGGVSQAGSPVCPWAVSAFPVQPRLWGGLSNVTLLWHSKKSQERLLRKTIHIQTEVEGICFQLAEKVPQEGQN